MKKYSRTKELIKKSVVYNLPLIKNFHAHKKLDITKSTFKNFYYNWYDIFHNKDNFITSQLTISSLKNYENSDVILFNFTNNNITVNINKSSIIIKENSFMRCECSHQTIRTKGKHILQEVQIGSSHYVFIGIEDILLNKNNIINTAFFKDFLMCCGISNSSQYIIDTGLNSILMKINGRKIEHAMMNEFVYLLNRHWKVSNIYLRKNMESLNRIPYIIHWIWLAKDDSVTSYDLSKFKKFMSSWTFRNPNCQFYLWTDISDIKLPKLDNIIIKNFLDIKKLFFDNNISKIINDRKMNVGIRADTLRQLILYKIGGLYVDINDMECLISFQGILNNYEYVCGTEPMLYCNNAIIGSIPKHILTKKMLDNISLNKDNIYKEFHNGLKGEMLDSWVIEQTGPKMYSEIIFGFLDHVYNEEHKIKEDISRILIGPSTMFYANYECKKNRDHWLTPLSLSAHYDGRTFV